MDLLKYFFIIYIGAIVFSLLMRIYWCADHGKWQSPCSPDSNARIISCTRTEKKIIYGLQELADVTFSDGYHYYTSYDTTLIVRYTGRTSTPEEEKRVAEVFRSAYAAHAKAVARALK